MINDYASEDHGFGIRSVCHERQVRITGCPTVRKAQRLEEPSIRGTDVLLNNKLRPGASVMAFLLRNPVLTYLPSKKGVSIVGFAFDERYVESLGRDSQDVCQA